MARRTIRTSVSMLCKLGHAALAQGCFVCVRARALGVRTHRWASCRPYRSAAPTLRSFLDQTNGLHRKTSRKLLPVRTRSMRPNDSPNTTRNAAGEADPSARSSSWSAVAYVAIARHRLRSHYSAPHVVPAKEHLLDCAVEHQWATFRACPLSFVQARHLHSAVVTPTLGAAVLRC